MSDEELRDEGGVAETTTAGTASRRREQWQRLPKEIQDALSELVRYPGGVMMEATVAAILKYIELPLGEPAPCTITESGFEGREKSA